MKFQKWIEFLSRTVKNVINFAVSPFYKTVNTFSCSCCCNNSEAVYGLGQICPVCAAFAELTILGRIEFGSFPNVDPIAVVMAIMPAVLVAMAA